MNQTIKAEIEQEISGYVENYQEKLDISTK